MQEMFCRRLPKIMCEEMNKRHVLWAELDRTLEKIEFPND